jgi:hypothetical protein
VPFGVVLASGRSLAFDMTSGISGRGTGPKVGEASPARTPVAGLGAGLALAG